MNLATATVLVLVRANMCPVPTWSVRSVLLARPVTPATVLLVMKTYAAMEQPL